MPLALPVPLVEGNSRTGRARGRLGIMSLPSDVLTRISHRRVGQGRPNFWWVFANRISLEFQVVRKTTSGKRPKSHRVTRFARPTLHVGEKCGLNQRLVGCFRRAMRADGIKRPERSPHEPHLEGDGAVAGATILTFLRRGLYTLMGTREDRAGMGRPAGPPAAPSTSEPSA